LLTEEQILAWADAHYARTGQWPTSTSGDVEGAPGETWSGLAMALFDGQRGLTPGSSLARLLAEHRDRRNHLDLPPLTVEQILAWADAHYARTGEWPSKESGEIPGTGGEKWSAIDTALHQGHRGLPGGTTLAQLLAAERGRFHPQLLPPLTVEQILAWADAHHARTGRWPRASSGTIPESPGDTWARVDGALFKGQRGLSPGDSLARLLERERGVRNIQHLPPLTTQQILAWAEEHFARTGKRPTRYSGPIPGAPGETWAHVEDALGKGLRGQPGGSSLAKLLALYPDRFSRPAPCPRCSP
jgi:hypothetical protein